MLVKRFIQLQFCLDKADKPQVMFYFPKIKWNCENIVHLKVCKCQDIIYSPEGAFTIQIKLWIQNSIVLNVLKSFQEPSTTDFSRTPF